MGTVWLVIFTSIYLLKNSGPRVTVSKGSNAVVIKTVVLSVYLSK